jgi:hypothetical protein
MDPIEAERIRKEMDLTSPFAEMASTSKATNGGSSSHYPTIVEKDKEKAGAKVGPESQ